MSKLYEISQQYNDTFDAIQTLFNNNPELSEQDKQLILEENLSELHDSFEVKGLALAGYIQNQKLEMNNVKEVIERLTKRAKQLDKNVNQLSDYLLVQMQQVNISKLSNAWLTAQIRNNPCKVIVEDETLIANEFKELISTIKVNKTAIAEQLKAGAVVPYAHLETTQRLDIR